MRVWMLSLAAGTLLCLAGCDKPSRSAPDLSLSGDAVVTVYQGDIYIIDRTRAVLRKVSGSVLDPAGKFVVAVTSNYEEGSLAFLKTTDLSAVFDLDYSDYIEYEVSLGQGTNPYGIAFLSAQKAYVIRYQSDTLLVINPGSGRVLGRISLRAYAASTHADTLPNLPFMSCALVEGGRLLVACQRLEAWQALDTSLVVVINTSTDSVEKVIPLRGRNPQDMVCLGNRLYLACTGDYFMNDGGIEAVDLDNDTSLGLLITETQVNGDINRLALVSAAKGYVTVDKVSADFTSNWSEVFPVDLAAKSAGARLGFIENGFGDIVYDGQTLYVGERGAQPGLVAVNPLNDFKIKGPVSTGLPPYNLAVLEK